MKRENWSYRKMNPAQDETDPFLTPGWDNGGSIFCWFARSFYTHKCRLMLTADCKLEYGALSMWHPVSAKHLMFQVIRFKFSGSACNACELSMQMYQWKSSPVGIDWKVKFCLIFYLCVQRHQCPLIPACSRDWHQIRCTFSQRHTS